MIEDEFKAMEADRKAGTPGPWEVDVDADTVIADLKTFTIVEGGESAKEPAHIANMRRIARLPDLETEVIALRANAKIDAWFAKAYHEWCRANGCPPSNKDLIEAMDRLALEGKR